MDNVRKAAVKTGKLEGRAGANQRFAGADFQGWLSGIVEQIAFDSVLDLCCGTGNQLLMFAKHADARRMVGVDLAEPSLETARQRLAETGYQGDLSLIAADMARAFDDPAIADHRFGLVSCCYGLYYADDPRLVLDRMTDAAPDGTLLIVGPYGQNNRALFDILERYFPLPPLVAESAGPFMTETVVPHLAERAKVRLETLVNPVRFPDTDAVMAYWRNTTFHDAAHEQAVAADIEAVVRDQGAFVIEKHVMAVIAGR